MTSDRGRQLNGLGKIGNFFLQNYRELPEVTPDLRVDAAEARLIFDGAVSFRFRLQHGLLIARALELVSERRYRGLIILPDSAGPIMTRVDPELPVLFRVETSSVREFLVRRSWVDAQAAWLSDAIREAMIQGVMET